MSSPQSRRKAGRPLRSAAPAASEDDLLMLAFQTFATRGFDATSMRDIAAKLGISHTLIHFRFGSKEELWRRAVDVGFHRASAAMDGVYCNAFPTETARLRELIRRFCALCAHAPETVSMMTMEAQQEGWRLDYLYTHHVEPFDRRLAQVLIRVAAEHQLQNLNAKAFNALMVHGAGGYFTRNNLIARQGPLVSGPLANLERDADIFADMLIGGLLAGSR